MRRIPCSASFVPGPLDAPKGQGDEMKPPIQSNDSSSPVQQLRDIIVGEPLFMEIGSTCLGRLGPYSDMTGNFRTVRLDPSEVLFWSLAMIYQVLLGHWELRAVQQTIQYVAQPHALAALVDSATDTECESFSGCIRYTQEFVAIALDRFVLEVPGKCRVYDTFDGPMELCEYLRSSKVIEDILDAMAKVSDGFRRPIDPAEEILISLVYCQETMSSLHSYVSVARCLQWMVRSPKVIQELRASPFCTEGDTLDRITFTCAFCATAIERIAF